MKMKLAVLAFAVAGLVACGNEPNKVEPDQSSSAMQSSVTDGSSSLSSSGGTSSVTPSSSGGTSVSTSSSSGGISTVTSSSSGGTSVVSSSSIGISTIAPSSSTGGTSVVTSSSVGISSVMPSSSAGGTSVVTPSSTANSGTIAWQGKTYRTTNIGGKMWFAENLDYGTQVSASSGQVNSGAVEKSCYDDNAANCTTYGGLYTWAEAMALPSTCNTTSCAGSINTTHQGICPDSWHIPTRADFAEMLQEVGVASIAGHYLKAQTGWDAGSIGTDEYGFTALPSGYFYVPSFYFIGIRASFRAATEDNTGTKAYMFSIDLAEAISGGDGIKTSATSIRCIKN